MVTLKYEKLTVAIKYEVAMKFKLIALFSVLSLYSLTYSMDRELSRPLLSEKSLGAGGACADGAGGMWSRIKKCVAKKTGRYNRELLNSVLQGSPEAVRSLISKGADVDAAGEYGQTALMFASIWGLTDMAKVLIDEGANLDIANNDGDTALILATWNSHTETAKALITAGANVNALGKVGCPALVWAARAGHAEVIRMLLERDANIPEYIQDLVEQERKKIALRGLSTKNATS